MGEGNIIDFSSRAGKFGEPEKIHHLPIETGGGVIDIGKKRQEKRRAELQKEINDVCYRMKEIYEMQNELINKETSEARLEFHNLNLEMIRLTTLRNKLLDELKT